ncbi:MAG: hypothetical protein E7426_00845 [Ruminococcaceae bacterium]|nr:hypothetical protein [Oscillospiraceae bacterium]
MQKTDEIFIEEVRTKAPNLSVLGRYRGVKEEVSFLCNICKGVFISTPDKILRGTKCPYCSGRKALPGFNDLLTLRPDIAKEWDQLKNEELHPYEVTGNSTKRVWFICPQGHSYNTSVRIRTQGGGCPYCAGKRVLRGFNDLMTIRPDIAKEWHPTKNRGLNPTDVTSGSSKKVWWKCSRCECEWQSIIAKRTSFQSKLRISDCPNCSAVFGTSFPEQAVFFYVKKAFSDAENRYPGAQYNVSEFDVFIPSLKTAIEYDGQAYHSSEYSLKREMAKYTASQEHNIRLIRIKEQKTVNPACDYCIITEYGNSPNYESLEESIQSLLNYLNAESIDINIERDQYDIQEQYFRVLAANSLANLFPSIAEEWHPVKNGKITPEMVSQGSNKRFWWKCRSCGFEWQTTIANRVSGRNCPQCSRIQAGQEHRKSVVMNKGSLADKYPQLIIEWDFDKNEISPREISSGSDEKVWWKCNTCGHEWQADIHSRTNGNGCPICGKVKQHENLHLSALKNNGSLLQNYPELCKEWDYNSNTISPDAVVAGSKLRVWWKCSVCGGKYMARVSNRALLHRGCPYCAGKQVLQGFNDLMTIRPDIAKEWHPTKNLGLKPEDIASGSSKRVWWKCSICGNEWEASVYRRVSGRNCPLCGTKKSAKAKHKPVICIETGMSFDSCKRAGQYYNIKNPSSSVASAARTGRKAGGYHWQFIDNSNPKKVNQES